MRRPAALSLFVILAVACRAEDWPRFRGPNGSGISASKDLPATFSASTNLVWKAALPTGYSSPVLSNRHIFLTALDQARLVTIALDRASGRTLWTRGVDRNRQEKLHKLNHPASPSAVTDGQSVWVFFPDFGLISYTASGEERWRRELGPFRNVYGMGASPILAGGAIVLVCDQGPGSHIAAFDAVTGKPLWKTPRPDALSGHSTPILYRPRSGAVRIIAPGSFRVDGYDAANGEGVWGFDGLPSEMKSVPVIDGATLYIHGFNTPDNDPDRLMDIPEFAPVIAANDKDRDGRLSKAEAPNAHVSSHFIFLDLDGDGQLDETEWRSYRRTMRAENALLAIGLDGKLKWKFQRSVPQLPSPLVYDGVVYMVNEAGILTTLDAAHGKLHKQARLPDNGGPYYASPVAADGKIFLAGSTGKIAVLKAGPAQEVIATNDLEEDIFATPAIAGSRIFVRTRSTLYCFGSP